MSTANLRAELGSELVAAVAARVALHDGETEHYRVNDEGDIIVSVLTLIHESPLWANLNSLVGGGGRGVWLIPDVGVEVLVSFDNGEFEGEAYICNMSTSGAAPAGLVPGVVFVLGSTVEIRDVGGVAVPVAKLSDVESLRDYVHNQFSATAGHVHGVSGAVTTSITSVPATPVATGVASPTVAPDEPEGTDVLRGQ